MMLNIWNVPEFSHHKGQIWESQKLLGLSLLKVWLEMSVGKTVAACCLEEALPLCQMCQNHAATQWDQFLQLNRLYMSAVMAVLGA